MEYCNGVNYGMGMSLLNRLKKVMGPLTQQQFADKIGVSVQAVNQWMVGRTNPGPKTLKTISEIFKVDLAWLTYGVDTEVSEPSINSTASQNVRENVFGDKDLPVYAAVEGGSGELVVSTDPIDLVPRPWYLGEVKNGYAIVVTGESMSPVYEPGDMVIINPRITYLRGKDHVFTTNSEDGHFKATIKRLVGVSETHWKVEQFNPPKVFSLDRAVWVNAKRVVGKYSG